MNFPVPDAPYYYAQKESPLLSHDVMKSPVFDVLHFDKSILAPRPELLHVAPILLNGSRLSNDAQSFLQKTKLELLFVDISWLTVRLVGKVDKSVGIQDNRPLEERTMNRIPLIIDGFRLSHHLA